MTTDPFDELVAGIELDTSDCVDYTQLSYVELVTLRGELKQELMDISEVRYPRTDEGRELHSKLTAVQAALNRRTQ